MALETRPKYCTKHHNFKLAKSGWSSSLPTLATKQVTHKSPTQLPLLAAPTPVQSTLRSYDIPRERKSGPTL
eukprot:2679476-Amphidinium_carterae.1